MRNPLIKKTLCVGLIPGRHDLPVEDYIFPESVDPTDLDGLNRLASTWIEAHCVPSQKVGLGLNQADWHTDVLVWGSDVELVLYVTGLTAATTAVVRACALNGISLTLMHYDRESGDYLPQQMW